MGLYDEVVEVPRRTMVLFFVVDYFSHTNFSIKYPINNLLYHTIRRFFSILLLKNPVRRLIISAYCIISQLLRE